MPKDGCSYLQKGMLILSFWKISGPGEGVPLISDHKIHIIFFIYILYVRKVLSTFKRERYERIGKDFKFDMNKRQCRAQDQDPGLSSFKITFSTGRTPF